MSIDTEFVYPAITQLELRTHFNLDPTTKIGTPEENESQVSQFIEDWVKENLGTFGKTFRRSNLLSEIDDIHPSILNSRMDVKINTFIFVTSNKDNPFLILRIYQYRLGLLIRIPILLLQVSLDSIRR